MNLKISKLLKISLGLALCGGGVFLGSQTKAEENASVSASSSSFWSTVDPKANADTLFTKLHALTDVSTYVAGKYDGLWDAYETTDLVPGTQKIWDMYGGFQFATNDRAGNYNGAGDCYNREHSIPKSWWGRDEDKRYYDIVHLVPTDGYVNNRRSSYAFGEVDSATYTHTLQERKDGYGNIIQTVGYSKLGSAKSINGINFSGTVFEPDDQYKGDFARIYYYFATRYGPSNLIATQAEGGKMFSNNANDFYMTNYGKALMNKWHVQDPVSQKEIDRNNGVEIVQGNRNPYVDHPEWADKIFGSNYAATHGGGGDTPSLSISASSYSMAVDGTITLTANVNNLSGTVQWYVEDYSEDVITLSATTGNSITVTGVGTGSKKVYAYIGNMNDWVNITVTSSGGVGGGGQGEPGSVIWDLTTKTYEKASAAEVVWNSDNVTMTLSKNTASTGANNYLGGNSNYNHTRFYKNQKLTIVPSNGVEISNVVFSVQDNSGFKSSSWNNAACSANTTTVTVEPLNGLIEFSGVFSDTSKVKSVTVDYGGGSSPEPTLSSVSLDTSKVQKTFTVGDTFTYSGLVVTANYSNNSSVVVTPTSVSSPDMSTAGNKTVTVSYTEDGVTQTSTYSITVNSQTINPTSITAGAVKEFYVGDVITKSDLYVEDNLENEITDFTFVNDGYMFKYSDSNPNGDLKVKDFENSVSYNGMTCSFSVVVKRKERTTQSTVTDTILASDLNATSTTYIDFSGVSKTSGAVYAGQSALDEDVNIQLRTKSSNSGIVSTSSSSFVSSVTITVAHGENRIDVFGKNTAYSAATDLYNNSSQGDLVGSLTATGTIEFETQYKYIGIRSGVNGAVYLSSIEITYGGGDNAKNLANYIMYNDQEGQCNDNFPIAETYFEGLSIAQRAEFMNSDEYVISCARERLLAWANYLGKTISQENGDYVIKNSNVNRGFAEELSRNDSSIIIISILCMGACLGSALYLFKRKRLSK